MDRPLRRISEKGWLGGVCPGIAYWLGLPTWLIRLLFIVLELYPVYMILWFILPKEDGVPEDFAEVTGD